MRLLGKEIEVIASTNSDQVGLRGEVLADNKETLVVRTAHGEKTLIKHTFTLKTDGFIIEGKSLQGTHAERTKRNK